MGKIVPHLWFDREVEEAVEFYTGLFENSKRIKRQELNDTPSGQVVSLEFTLANQDFQAINGGPSIIFNSSISFTVLCDSKEELQTYWEKFLEDGHEIHPLQTNGDRASSSWVEDKYGITWQLLYEKERAYDQKIIPSLAFSKAVSGKAEEAIAFYTNIFQHGQEKQAPATFQLMQTIFKAVDTENEEAPPFNEAISLIVFCVTQSEIDYYWEKLSADSEAEECGWLKDKYGVSWQIVPERLSELLSRGSQAQIDAVTQRFLQMKKLNISELETAWQTA